MAAPPPKAKTPKRYRRITSDAEQVVVAVRARLVGPTRAAALAGCTRQTVYDVCGRVDADPALSAQAEAALAALAAELHAQTAQVLTAILATIHARVLREGAKMPMGALLDAVKTLGALAPPGRGNGDADALVFPDVLSQPRPDGAGAQPPSPQ